MVRKKSAPICRAAPAPAPLGEPLLLRIRDAAGVKRLLARSDWTLGVLRREIEGLVQVPEGQLQGLSARGLRHATDRVHLLQDGRWPAGGSILISAEMLLSTLGLKNGDILEVQTAAKATAKAKAKASPAKRSPKKSPGAKRKRKRGAGSPGATSPGAASPGNPRKTPGLGKCESLAVDFLTSIPEDGMMSLGQVLHTTAEGTHRVESAGRGLVHLEATASGRIPRAIISWRAAPRRRLVEEDVLLLAPDECVEVCFQVLKRQGGSKRRRLASGKPSTRALRGDVLASRCPALFWSLYHHSKGDATMRGDVGYALANVVPSAERKFHAWVQAEGSAEAEATSPTAKSPDGTAADATAASPFSPGKPAKQEVFDGDLLEDGDAYLPEAEEEGSE